MKVTVDRKELVKTLKSLKTLAALAPDVNEMFKHIITLNADDNGLTIMATSATAFLSIILPAEVSEHGTCHISYSLYDLAKAAKDEQLTLTYAKKLIVSGISGFKASLTQNESMKIPYTVVTDHVASGVNSAFTIRTDELLNLCQISNAFPEQGGFRWVEVISTEGIISGAIQQTELGGLEGYPMTGEGDDLSFVVRPELISAVLTFCGEYSRIGTLISAQGFLFVDDPNRPGWYGLVGTQKKPT